MFVGHRGKYKNFLWLLQSLEDFLKKFNLGLICGGSDAFSEYEQSVIAKLHLADKVTHVPVNSDSDLVTLYSNAACFIFPSLYEGFGIPILEAFSCRCPVVLPYASCFPEIGGEAALYYDKNDPASLTRHLENILNEPALADHLRAAGSDRLKFFNWENMVAEHIEMYDAITGKN